MSIIGGYFPKLPRIPGPRPFVAPQPPSISLNRPKPPSRAQDRTGQVSPSGCKMLRRAPSSSLDFWVFLCGWCGSEFTAQDWNVMSGRQKSCGCYRREHRKRDELGRFEGSHG